MRTDCGCIEIKHEPLEFEITGPVPNLTRYSIVLPNTSEEDWCRLKNKIIFDFQDVVKKLECGIQPDIELLLEEISLMYMKCNCNFNITKQVFTTNPEEEPQYLTKQNLLTEFETEEEKNQVLANIGVTNILNTTTSTLNAAINELNDTVNTKVGFVRKIGDMYYGFTSNESYIEWIKQGSDDSSNLILAKWISANFVPNYYTIIFDTMGGNLIESQEVIEGYSIDIPTPTWPNEDRIFQGWYDNINYTGNTYSGTYTPKSNKIFYAKWRQAPLTNLIMYSFSTKQNANYTSSFTTTNLTKNTESNILNRMKYHYIPSDVPITITKEEYGEYGVQTVVIGYYDNNNKVYKIEDMSLINENIKYN